MLHCTARAARALGLQVHALHVHHGLQPDADAWTRRLAAQCRRWARGGLPVTLHVQRLAGAPAAGDSVEAWARRERYAALAAMARAAGCDTVLLAQHRRDQAETVLLQLLRGAGPHGLAAMPTTSRLGPGWLLRPLLEVDRSELLDYALEHGLHWIEDVSNADTRFDRNYLRQRILPLLRERWPAVGRNLARSARWCAETADWLDADADADLARVAAQRPDALHIPALRELGEPRQRNALRRWLRRLGLPVPDSQQLRHILHDALTAARDR
ncbi:MAG: tRNA lysidine(34) synthetase TilS, partial [Rhodoferax sp.]|nr:tRNA lysidine(34) synthetase TilS [Rhodoferax sp.]